MNRWPPSSPRQGDGKDPLVLNSLSLKVTCKFIKLVHPASNPIQIKSDMYGSQSIGQHQPLGPALLHQKQTCQEALIIPGEHILPFPWSPL